MTIESGAYVRPLPITAWYHEDTTQANLVATSYETGDPEVGVYFVAPQSGVVRITVGAGIRDNGASARDRVFVSPAVYQVTPTGMQEILVPSVTLRGFGGSEAVTAFAYGCRVSLLEDLTPGQLYYARTMHFTSTGADPDTADIAARDIIVIPMP